MPIISFSGIDGSGKGANIDLLVKLLLEHRLKTKCLSGRFGYTPLFLRLKFGLLNLCGEKKEGLGQFKSSNSLFKRRGVLWKFVSCLDYILYYGIYARIFNVLGFFVVIDRYIIDLRVDLALACDQQLPTDRIVIFLLKTVLPKPDLSFFLAINSSCSVRRSRKKNDPFKEEPKMIENRLKLYNELLSNEKVIDASQDLENVSSRISSEVITWRDSQR